MKVNLDTSKSKLSIIAVIKELSLILDDETDEESQERFDCLMILEDLKKRSSCKELIKNGVKYNGVKSKYDCPIDLNGLDYYPLI
ncbi:MAG: hypothetical protein PHC28_09285 [Flavobacterium sp.]|uniref:hypothetical protein n=1 Tax=Flavobacterium sp. TaxID=239 RepID=UPI002610C075|nr:hypothetical protein [Flavobacterium sp.]MDD5150662.1 hypothetical protein [Flavobacterium sp.]